MAQLTGFEVHRLRWFYLWSKSASLRIQVLEWLVHEGAGWRSEASRRRGRSLGYRSLLRKLSFAECRNSHYKCESKGQVLAEANLLLTLRYVWGTEIGSEGNHRRILCWRNGVSGIPESLVLSPLARTRLRDSLKVVSAAWLLLLAEPSPQPQRARQLC